MMMMMLMMVMQQQLEVTSEDQKREISSLKERLMMGQDSYKEIFLCRHELLAKLNKLKSTIYVLPVVDLIARNLLELCVDCVLLDCHR